MEQEDQEHGKSITTEQDDDTCETCIFFSVIDNISGGDGVNHDWCELHDKKTRRWKTCYDHERDVEKKPASQPEGNREDLHVDVEDDDLILGMHGYTNEKPDTSEGN